MASERQYAYYLEGNRIAIVEKDTSFSNNVDNKELTILEESSTNE